MRHAVAPAVCGVLAIVVSLSTPPAHAGVVIDPIGWGLSPGDTFRVVVVTAGGTTGISASIADYDAFVNSQGLSGITYGGSSLSWQAIARTPTSDPVGDGSRYSSAANATHIYNLNGLRVSGTVNGSAFWQTTGYNQHTAAIDWTIDGSGNRAQVGAFQLVWTGFDWDGAATTANAFDSSGFPVGTVTAVLSQAVDYTGYDYGTNAPVPATLYPAVGRAGALANGWASIDNKPLASVYSLYAMSELITVMAVPEPSALALAAAGAFGIAAAWSSRRARGGR